MLLRQNDPTSFRLVSNYTNENTPASVHTYVRIHNTLWVKMHVRTYVQKGAACTYVRTYVIHTYVHTTTPMRTHQHQYTHTHTTCVCITYTEMYVHMYVCTYVRMHVQMGVARTQLCIVHK